MAGSGGFAGANPGNIVVSRSVLEGHIVTGPAISLKLGVPAFPMDDASTETISFIHKVPLSWDISVDPTMVFHGITDTTGVSQDYSLSVVMEYLSDDTAVNTDMETLAFVETADDASGIYFEATAQNLDRTKITPGGSISVEFSRLRAAGGDTRPGDLFLTGVDITFSRTSLESVG